jgi:hypothetical protein
MATVSWIRAEDGDWYRATEVVAVKTLPHPEGGHMVTIETHRHDNIDVTGPLEHADSAHRGRDALVRLLAGIEDGTVLTYSDGRFDTEDVR